MDKESKKLKEKIIELILLIIRPFIDFYFNYGLSKASVLSYILSVNLIIVVYLLMIVGATIIINPIISPSNVRRFLEIHFLWPIGEKIIIEEAPEDFKIKPGTLISIEKYKKIIKEYCKNNNTSELFLKNEGYLKIRRFSITAEIGKEIYYTLQKFYSKKLQIQALSLGAISFFIILLIAYIGLILSIKSSLAESVSPLIWGNLPLSKRKSEIKKILWKINSIGKFVKKILIIIIMLPVGVVLFLTAISFLIKLIDTYIASPYTFINNFILAIVSFGLTIFTFYIFYINYIPNLSWVNALLGASISSFIWVISRYLLTNYIAISLYRNLRNFVFLPLILSWFYYLCILFLLGAYISHTVEDPKLSLTSRSWVMKDILLSFRYNTLSMWVRLDFLYRLALNRYEEHKPPFIGIEIIGDTADEIARSSNLSPIFVRECILEMIAKNDKIFQVEIEGNRQYCKLKYPPEEIDIIPLLIDKKDIEILLEESPDYLWGKFIINNFGYYWKIPSTKLSDIYIRFKNFEKEYRENNFFK